METDEGRRKIDDTRAGASEKSGPSGGPTIVLVACAPPAATVSATAAKATFHSKKVLIPEWSSDSEDSPQGAAASSGKLWPSATAARTQPVCKGDPTPMLPKARPTPKRPTQGRPNAQRPCKGEEVTRPIITVQLVTAGWKNLHKLHNGNCHLVGPRKEPAPAWSSCPSEEEMTAELKRLGLCPLVEAMQACQHMCCVVL